MTTPVLEPDRGQIEIFVAALFRRAGQRGFVLLRSFYEAEDKPFRLSSARLSGSLRFLIDVAEDDARRAAQNPVPVVFCPPLVVFANRDHAREEDIALGLALSVECDQHPAEARAKLEALLGAPTAVVRSGGTFVNGGDAPEDKLHLHWRLKTPAGGHWDQAKRHDGDLAKLKTARELAAQLVGADSSNVPVCHPIRWPGSWHRKAEPRMCEIVQVNPDNEIDLDAALAALKTATREQTPGAEAEAKTEAGAGADRADKRPTDELVSNIITGHEFYPSLVPLSARLVGSGLFDGTAVILLRALMKASTAPHDVVRWLPRYNKIPGIVSSAREKYQQDTTPQAASSEAVFDPWQRHVVPAFPVDILPPEARDFVCTQGDVIGCDVAGMAMSVLVTFSGALHHGFALKMLRNGSWWASPRLWVLLVGPPSCKKTPIFNAATDPLLKYECRLREKHEQEQQLFEKAQKAGDKCVPEPDKPLRYVVWDTTVEKLGEILARNNGDKGVLVKSDELAGWLASMERYSSAGGRSDRAFWLQAYDGGPHAVDRIKRGELFIKNLSVSIVGGIQPERLAEIRTGLSSDGLLQRFLPVMLRSPAFRQDRQGLDENYGALVRQLIFAKPERLIMTDAALAAMEALHKHLFDLEQVSDALTAGFDSFVGKLAGICGNLALILHMAHDPKLGATYAVDENTVQDVRRLILDFVLPHALEFYRGAEASAGDRLRRVASWILTSGVTRVLASDLTRNVRDCRTLDLMEINKRVAPLVACGWLRSADTSPVCKWWDVDPRVHIQLAERARDEDRRKGALTKLMDTPRPHEGR